MSFRSSENGGYPEILHKHNNASKLVRFHFLSPLLGHRMGEGGGAYIIKKYSTADEQGKTNNNNNNNKTLVI